MTEKRWLHFSVVLNRNYKGDFVMIGGLLQTIVGGLSTLVSGNQSNMIANQVSNSQKDDATNQRVDDAQRDQARDEVVKTAEWLGENSKASNDHSKAMLR